MGQLFSITKVFLLSITQVSILLLSIQFITTLSHGQQLKKIDSLKQVILTLPTAERFESLKELYYLYSTFDYNKSYEISLQAINAAIEKNDSLLIIRSNRMNGYALLNLSKYDEAIEVFLKVLKYAESGYKNRSIKEQIKFILNSIALTYNDIGLFEKSLEYHFKSLKLRKADSNQREVAISLNNIGLVYYRMNGYKNALDFYEQSLKLKREIYQNEPNEIATILINISLCHTALKSFDEAIKSVDEAIQLCNNNCSNDIQRDAFISIGNAYYETNNLPLASEFYLKSLSIARNQNNIVLISANLISLSKIEIKKGNRNEALKYLKEADLLLGDTNNPNIKLDLYSNLCSIYENWDDQRHREYLLKYIKLKNSIYNLELISGLKELSNKDNNMKDAVPTTSNNMTTFFLVLSNLILFIIAGTTTFLILKRRRAKA